MEAAVGAHLRWVSLNIFVIIVLFAPFAYVALIYTAINDRVQTTIVDVLFCVSTGILAYFYADGFVASHKALLA